MNANIKQGIVKEMIKYIEETLTVEVTGFEITNCNIIIEPYEFADLPFYKQLLRVVQSKTNNAF